MKIKRYVKIIAIFICIIFIFMALESFVFSSDIHHLECCHEENCIKCTLIKIAINFINNLNYIIKYIVLLNIAIPLSYVLFRKFIKNKEETLIELKVELNE